MSKTFCNLPWVHLATHPNGTASLCCQSEMAGGISFSQNKNQDGLLTLNKNSVSDIVNSDLFREVRLSMLKGEKHPACATCWRLEDKGLPSKRLREKNVFPLSIDAAIERTASDGSIEPAFDFIELRLGNVCNIKCVTCNPNSSSKHVSDFKKIHEDYKLDFVEDYSWSTPDLYKWTESNEFWDDLLSHSKKLDTVYINGGEPTYIKAHWSFLEGLIKRGKAKEIKLIYSINMTNLPPLALELWREFKEVKIEASIDDLDQRNFYIRYPTVWDKVLQNLETLIKSGACQVQRLQTVGSLNLLTTAKAWKWFYIRFPELTTSFNHIVDPRYYSALAMPAQIRREILDTVCPSLPEYLASNLKRMYDTDEENPEHWQQFKQMNKVFDQIRGLDVREYFTELEELLNRNNQSLYS